MTATTTSIKLTEELKTQISDTAKRRGKTAHALMIECLQQAMDDAQLEDEFYQDAVLSAENLERTNIAYSFDEIAKVARARAKGDFTVQAVPHAYDPRLPMRPELRMVRERRKSL